MENGEACGEGTLQGEPELVFKSRGNDLSGSYLALLTQHMSGDSPKTDHHEESHSWQSPLHLPRANETKAAALKPCPQCLWAWAGCEAVPGPQTAVGSAPFLLGLGQLLKGLETSGERQSQQWEGPKWSSTQRGKVFLTQITAASVRVG